MDRKFSGEEELYQPVKDYFVKMDYEVKGEVAYCDICCIKDDNLIVVELKKGLTIDLLIQATKRQKIADFVYVAIPNYKINFYSKKWRDKCNLLRRLELGLIVVSRNQVKVVLEPKAFDFKRSQYSSKKKKLALITEFNERKNDYNIGGSKGKKLLTSYRECAVNIALYIKENGPTSAAILSSEGFDKKRVYSILYKNYYGWFKRVSRGMYDIVDKYNNEILQYKNHMKNNIY